MTKSSKQKLDYQKEYNARPEEMDKRVARNRERRKALAEGKVSIGDGKDIAHKKALSNGGSVATSNTKVQDAKTNRGWRKNSGYKVPNGK